MFSLLMGAKQLNSPLIHCAVKVNG